MLTQSACMRSLASFVVYLVDVHHLDHMSVHMSRRDNHIRILVHMMNTRSRTCA